jgi:large subunit ribosomal protein L15
VLKAAGLIRGRRDGVRILAQGEIKTAIIVDVAGASRAALAAIEKAGGKVILSARPEAAAGAGGDAGSKD